MTSIPIPDGVSFSGNRDQGGAASASSLRLLYGLVLLVVTCQIWLIFNKAINWDEFLHFGQIYELADGRLTNAIQTLPARFFGWVTTVSDDVILQIKAIRLVMLCATLFTAALIAMLARKLATPEFAILCSLVYLTAGYVFTNSFSYRTDPLAAATLMGALYFFVSGQLTWGRVALIGVLVGFAGALTVKSIIYLPCFAAIAWLRWDNAANGKLREMIRFAAIVIAAVLTFVVLITLHGANLPANEVQSSSLQRSYENFFRFFEFEMIRYVFAQGIFAPLVTLCLFGLPLFARGLPRNTKILLLGLCGPLLCLLFYRNTFPYFFTFLLPPICVAIAPALSRLVNRYGRVPVIGLALFGPVFLLVQEPYGTLQRQQATIDEIERLFPEPTPYLSYSSYVPHYPRVFPSLISGVALKRYWEERSGQISEKIEAGEIAFVIATGDALDAVFKDEEKAPWLPERDMTTLYENFIKHSDTIFILGRRICGSLGEQQIPIYRTGPYSIDGGDISVNGELVRDRTSIMLSAGVHQITYQGSSCINMWALDHVPVLPEGFPDGPIAGNF